MEVSAILQSYQLRLAHPVSQNPLTVHDFYRPDQLTNLPTTSQ